MEKNLIDVTNKSSGLVVFTTSFGRREFYAGQTRKIDLEELKELSQMPGGSVMLANFLYIENPRIMLDELEINTEPEYYIKEEDIPKWMETCTLDQFKDALDFAPLGTKDIIKKLAVEMQLNDFSKRQAIKDQLNFDVSAAIEALAPEPGENTSSNKPAQRRVAPAASNTGRRTSVQITIPKKEEN